MLEKIRALQLLREARMVSPAMGAAMIGTMYFLRANCAQHGGKASGGGLVSASLLKFQGSRENILRNPEHHSRPSANRLTLILPRGYFELDSSCKQTSFVANTLMRKVNNRKKYSELGCTIY